MDAGPHSRRYCRGAPSTRSRSSPTAPSAVACSQGATAGWIRYPRDDFRRTLPRFQAEAFDTNVSLAENLSTIADPRECTPAQVALAWVLAQGPSVVAIPGTRRIEHLEQNVAADAISLTDAELQTLWELEPPVGTAR